MKINPRPLATRINQLKPAQVNRLKDTLQFAAMAFYNGKDYREIFRREKHQSVGFEKKIYELLQTATEAEINYMTAVLIGEINEAY